MANQVKFYSVSSTDAKSDANGIYFVSDTSELYKGTTRFGANKVYDAATAGVASEADYAKITDKIAGDILIGLGGAKVFNGTTFVDLGADTSALQSSWRTDIKDWTSALVAGGSGSMLTGITRDADGKVTATAIQFPQVKSPADGVVSIGGSSVKISGWDTITSDLESRVSNIETWKSSVTGDTIIPGTKLTAASGKFTNLTVEDTATFTATTVSASTLAVDSKEGATFGGSTIAQIAQDQIDALPSSWYTAFGTSTKGGVFAVKNVVFDGGKIVGGDPTVELEQVANKATTIPETTTTENYQYPTVKAVQEYVKTKLSDVVSPMNFLGVKASTSAVTVPKNGDVILVGTKEYVYDGTQRNWIELGDEEIYVTKNALKDIDADKDVSGTATKAGTFAMTGITQVDASITSIDTSVELEKVANKVSSIPAAAIGTENWSYPTAKAVQEYVSAVVTSAAPETVSTHANAILTANSSKFVLASVITDIDATLSVSGTAAKGGVFALAAVTQSDAKLTSKTDTVELEAVSNKDTTIAAYSTTDPTENHYPTTGAVKTYVEDNVLVWRNAAGAAL